MIINKRKKYGMRDFDTPFLIHGFKELRLNTISLITFKHILSNVLNKEKKYILSLVMLLYKWCLLICNYNLSF